MGMFRDMDWYVSSLPNAPMCSGATVFSPVMLKAVMSANPAGP